MIPEAARMRKWLLRGMPLMLLCTLCLHAGGGAAGMLVWMILGCLLLPPTRYPYFRKRRPRPGGLFFAWSLFALGLHTAQQLLPRLFPGAEHHFFPLLAYYAGWAGWLLPLSCAGLFHPQGRRAAWALGALCWIGVLLMAGR